MAKQTFTTGSVLTATQMNDLQTNDFNWTVNQKTASYVLVASDKGTRIEMNASGATTVTVNTGLFNAGDTLFIQNIGAGVCTVTAGTATVQRASNASLALAQYQGGYLYFVSASNAVFFADAGFTSPLTTKGDLFTWDTGNQRLAVGANNTVLTADSATATGLKWATVAAAGKNYSLFGTGTLTGAATVTVTGISGADSILVLIKGASSVNAQSDICIRINADTNINYYCIGNTYAGAAAYAAGNSYGDDFTSNRIVIGKLSTVATSTASGYALIGGCNAAGKKVFQIAGGGSTSGGNGQQSYTLGGFWDNTSTVTSISLFSTTGNFDAGTFEVYTSA